jgi:AbiTii
MSPTRRDRGLLARIEQAALDEAVPVKVALRQCLSLGGRAGSAALRDGASKELHGYGPDDELPAYRVLPAVLKIDGALPGGWIRGQPFSPLMLPDVVKEVLGTEEQIRLRQGIAEIEKLAADANDQQERVRVPLPDSGLIAQWLSQKAAPGQHVIDVYWHVPENCLYGAVDQVRSRLVALVAELVAAMPGDQEIPSGELADQVVGVVIHGAPRSTYHVNNAQATGGGHSSVTGSGPEPDGDNPGRKRRRLLASVAGGLVAFASMIAGLGQWLGWRLPWR